jgi:hypothetical protein
MGKVDLKHALGYLADPETLKIIFQKEIRRLSQNPIPENPKATLGSILEKLAQISKIDKSNKELNIEKILTALKEILNEKILDNNKLVLFKDKIHNWFSDYDFNRALKKFIIENFTNHIKEEDTQNLDNLYKWCWLIYPNSYVVLSNLNDDPTTQDKLIELVAKDTENLNTFLDLAVRDQSDQLPQLIKAIQKHIPSKTLINLVISRTKDLLEEINQYQQKKLSKDDEYGSVLIENPIKNIDYEYLIHQGLIKNYQQLIIELLKSEDYIQKPFLFKTFFNSINIESSNDVQIFGNNFEPLKMFNSLDLSKETLLSKEWIKQGLLNLMNNMINLKSEKVKESFEIFCDCGQIFKNLDPQAYQQYLKEVLVNEINEEENPILNHHLRFHILKELNPEIFQEKTFANILLNQGQIVEDSDDRKERIAYLNAKNLVDIPLISLSNFKNKKVYDKIEEEAQIRKNLNKLKAVIRECPYKFLGFLHSYMPEDDEVYSVVNALLNRDVDIKKAFINFYIQNPYSIPDPAKAPGLLGNWLKHIKKMKI